MLTHEQRAKLKSLATEVIRQYEDHFEDGAEAIVQEVEGILRNSWQQMQRRHQVENKGREIESSTRVSETEPGRVQVICVVQGPTAQLRDRIETEAIDRIRQSIRDAKLGEKR